MGVFGWTPGLRRLVQGRVCSCGCLVGLYETSGGRQVEIVDCVDSRCHAGHENDLVISSSIADDTQGQDSAWLVATAALRRPFR
jgi:hypothetical protein